MKTVNVTTEDGFTGTLQLDIGSIKSEVKGYKNSTYTVAETREYPNLSSPDTSLVPKSITVNGKQYNLADINWESNGNMIDDVTIPSTYKAIAKYTTTATQQTLTGYTTTASYSGILSKVIDGKIIYTAYFDGSPMDTHYGNLEKQLQLDKEINNIMYEDYYTQDVPLDIYNLQDMVYGDTEDTIYETLENEDINVENTKDEANIIYIEDAKKPTSSLLMFAFLIGLIIFCYKKYILNLIKELKLEKELEENEIDYLKEKLTLGSLFDGIGVFPLSAINTGEIVPIWASEIEKFPIEVTKHHFPNIQHLGDITKLKGENIPPVDIVTNKIQVTIYII